MLLGVYVNGGNSYLNLQRLLKYGHDEIVRLHTRPGADMNQANDLGLTLFSSSLKKLEKNEPSKKPSISNPSNQNLNDPHIY